MSEQRYRIEEFLGAGGTGQVYRAWDTMLNRPVALKLLRSSQTAALDSAFLEARAQAQVSHPGICPVFDVGEQNGKAYIASQLIDGESLAATPRLGVERAVEIVREVARAVEAAHAQSLVHRDLKPQNVMIDPAGHPLVVDFGIAASSTTQAEAQLATSGTPAYMAPEQIRGGPDSVEPPVDVYALGGLLHELLTGEPPFTAATEIELLKKVLSEDPPRLRAQRPELPRELDAIAFRCLEKVPTRRYASAAEVADDLERWITRRPVEALPSTLRYRARLWLGRHKQLVVASGLLLLAAMAAGGLWLKQLAAGRAQARLARDFGAEGQRLAAYMQLVHLSPSDDVRSARGVVRQRMEELERRIESLGPLALGPGQDALGQAELRLGTLESANRHFELAWEAGYREPSVALGQAEAMARLYAESQRTLYYLQPTIRALRQERLRRQWLEPALDKLRWGLNSATVDSDDQESVDTPVTDTPVTDTPAADNAYLATLQAFLEDRFADVPALAQAALASEPFRYENRLLEGYAWRSRAVLAELDGKERDVRENLLAARRAFAAAAAIARSDPRVFQEICQTDEALLYDSLRQSTDADLVISAACQRATTLAPEDVGPRLARAGLNQRRALIHDRSGESPDSALAQARKHLEQALEIAPSHVHTHLLMATQHLIELDVATWHQAAGRDKHADAVLALTERAIELDPQSVWAPYLLGQAHYRRAEVIEAAGGDPSRSVTAARKGFEDAIERAPQVSRAHSALGSLLDWFAVVQTEMLGQDPGPIREAAIKRLERAVEIDPRNAIPLSQLGIAHMFSADYLMRIGADPTPEIEAADEIFASVLTLRPRSISTLSNRSELWLIAVEFELRTNSSPTAYPRHRVALEQAVERDTDEFGCSLAKSEWYRARLDAKAGRAPHAAIARGLAITEEMMERVGPSRYCLRDRARLLLAKLQAEVSHDSTSTPPSEPGGGIEAEATWAEGCRLLDLMAKGNSRDFQLWDLRGGYALFAARSLEVESSPARAKEAVAAYERAIELYPRRPWIQAQLETARRQLGLAEAKIRTSSGSPDQRIPSSLSLR